jgi:hypothetical protein
VATGDLAVKLGIGGFRDSVLKRETTVLADSPIKLDPTILADSRAKLGNGGSGDWS